MIFFLHFPLGSDPYWHCNVVAKVDALFLQAASSIKYSHYYWNLIKQVLLITSYLDPVCITNGFIDLSRVEFANPHLWVCKSFKIIVYLPGFHCDRISWNWRLSDLLKLHFIFHCINLLMLIFLWLLLQQVNHFDVFRKFLFHYMLSCWFLSYSFDEVLY